MLMLLTLTTKECFSLFVGFEVLIDEAGMGDCFILMTVWPFHCCITIVYNVHYDASRPFGYYLGFFVGNGTESCSTVCALPLGS